MMIILEIILWMYFIGLFGYCLEYYIFRFKKEFDFKERRKTLTHVAILLSALIWPYSLYYEFFSKEAQP